MINRIEVSPLKCWQCGCEIYFSLETTSRIAGEIFTGKVFDRNGTELQVGDRVFRYDPIHDMVELPDNSLEVIRLVAEDNIFLREHPTFTKGLYTFRNPDTCVLLERKKEE